VGSPSDIVDLILAVTFGHHDAWLEKQRKNRYSIGLQIHDEISIELPMQTIQGRFYIHAGRGHPVKVISGRNQVWTGDSYKYMYLVEDVVTGQTFNVKRRELGDELNEMEVIAWLAQ
jgi:hypothetical protein